MPKAEERKLAAIMFADIVGYSRMMSLDEDRTLELLKDFELRCFPYFEEAFEGNAMVEAGVDILWTLACGAAATNYGSSNAEIHIYIVDTYLRLRPDPYYQLRNPNIIKNITKKENIHLTHLPSNLYLSPV